MIPLELRLRRRLSRIPIREALRYEAFVRTSRRTLAKRVAKIVLPLQVLSRVESIAERNLRCAATGERSYSAAIRA